MKRIGIAFLSAALVMAACSDDSGSTATTAAGDTTIATDAPTTTGAPTTTVPEPTQADAATEAAVQAALDAGPVGCDPLDATRCLLPFPSNAYTAADDGTDTGLRVAMPAGGLATSESGVAIDLTEWNRNDGFSPNTPMLAMLPGIDGEASNLPTWTDIGASLNDDATVVLIDTTTGERVPLWAEIDAEPADPSDRLLTIRPAVALPEGHTFVVGLRGMADSAGAPLEPSEAFRVYRDNLVTTIDEIEARRPSMEANFAALEAAGIARGDLQLAWDFTVASTRSISERMLHIRDDALATLGEVAPAYTITEVTPNSHDNIALQIEGTYTVPNLSLIHISEPTRPY